MSTHVFGAMRVECSWCGATLREGPPPVSHGACATCAARLLEDFRKGRAA
jgi:hypothetical protein